MTKGRNRKEQKIINNVYNHKQEHILRFWDELDDRRKDILIEAIEAINFDLLEKAKTLLLKNKVSKRTISPPEVVKIPETETEMKEEKEAREIGEKCISQSKVAVFTAAGGQGSRLGIDYPKGMYPVTPIRKKSLFQVHAEKILYIEKKFNVIIPWIIMVSRTNKNETVDFFKSKGFFDLNSHYVKFIEQGIFPAIDNNGKIFLQDKYKIFLSPTGHGGTFSALRDSDTISWLKELSIEEIFYFQVDNVLVKILDPVFIGRHVKKNCEMSSKCVLRAPKEKIGIFVLQDGKPSVIEYSEIPGGDNRYDNSKDFMAGNIAIHMLNVRFAEDESINGLKLPFHLAHKAILFINEDGKWVKPEMPNGYKFETFIFDALRDTVNTVVMEVKREEEFSPLKNKSGENSPTTVLRDQNRLFASWFESSGVDVPYGDNHILIYKIEVSPLFASSREDFVNKIDKTIFIDKDTYIE